MVSLLTVRRSEVFIQSINMTVVVIKSDYLLETPGISKYSNKVKIFDRSGQSAGNPLKYFGDTLRGGVTMRIELTFSENKDKQSVYAGEVVINIRDGYLKEKLMEAIVETLSEINSVQLNS